MTTDAKEQAAILFGQADQSWVTCRACKGTKLAQPRRDGIKCQPCNGRGEVRAPQVPAPQVESVEVQTGTAPIMSPDDRVAFSLARIANSLERIADLAAEGVKLTVKIKGRI